MHDDGLIAGGDPYEVLGVAAGASRQDIVRAYRRAVHGAHPDARPADPRAGARFRALTEAYDLLTDAGQRAAYDRRTQSKRPGPGPQPYAVPGSMPGAPLRAGPVRVNPPARQQAGSADGPPWSRPGAPAEQAELPGWYLTWVWRP